MINRPPAHGNPDTPPFLVCFISPSRDFVRFLVDGGAAIKVASTIVPWRNSKPRSVKTAVISSNNALLSACFSVRIR